MDGTIARAYRARLYAEELARQSAARGFRVIVRPQADGCVLIVNGPEWDVIWATAMTAKNKKRRSKR
jgi:hypothetical protein